MKPFSRNRFFLLAILLIGLILYLPSLFGPFVWDDEDFVYGNKYVEEFRVGKFFTDSQTAGRGKLSNYYRPIPQIAYAATHVIFGFNPFWYHLLNVLVHISAACIIYYFFYLIFSAGDDKKASGPALLTALFFLIHPVQTEAVSYISGLSDPLFVFCGFLSLIFFLLRDERKNMIPLSLFFFALSLLSKETGIVFLPLLFLLQITNVPFKLLTFLNSLKKNLIPLFPFFLVAVFFLWFHLTFINNLDIKSAWGGGPYASSVLVRLLTFIQNLYAYIGLLIFPKDLFMERDYTIPIQTQILNPYLIIFLLSNFLIIFSLWKFRHSFQISNFKLQILVFCYLSFFVSFLPYTGIILINGIFYEHFLYLPLVFFFAFWITIFSSSHLARLNKVVFICVALILSALAIRNISRQLDWTDAVRFYSQTLEHAPRSIRIINGLGMAHADKGNLDGAINTYNRGLAINPAVPNLYHNLANAQAAKGEISKAEENYLKALEVDPNFFFSASSLARLYEQTGQKSKLEQLLLKYRQ